MTPVGPYRNQWASSDFYLVSTVKDKEVVFVVVPNGTQATESSLLFVVKRDAFSYLSENGFELKEKLGS